MSKYTWARRANQEIWMNGNYENREDAIEAGTNEIKSDNIINQALGIEGQTLDKFYVGKSEQVIPKAPDADLILGIMWDELSDDHHLDLVESAMLDIKREEINLLQEKLNKIWDEWLDETDHIPNLYTVKDIEEVKI
jgi:hypothetical protein